MKNTEKLLSYHDLIATIVTASESRDQYTAEHSERVATMTEKICVFLGLSEDQTTMYHIAAHLHDIGKIGVDDAVLRKAGKLDDAEWKQMKRHSIIGYDILDNVKDFYEIARIVRGHHERYDGKGYPDGLRGENILLGSRIIAIADSIDAMRSDRAYRRKMSDECCKEQILLNSGEMYDPAIVNTVRSHWNEFHIYQ